MSVKARPPLPADLPRALSSLCRFYGALAQAKILFSETLHRAVDCGWWKARQRFTLLFSVRLRWTVLDRFIVAWQNKSGNISSFPVCLVVWPTGHRVTLKRTRWIYFQYFLQWACIIRTFNIGVLTNCLIYRVSAPQINCIWNPYERLPSKKWKTPSLHHCPFAKFAPICKTIWRYGDIKLKYFRQILKKTFGFRNIGTKFGTTWVLLDNISLFLLQGTMWRVFLNYIQAKISVTYFYIIYDFTDIVKLLGRRSFHCMSAPRPLARNIACPMTSSLCSGDVMHHFVLVTRADCQLWRIDRLYFIRAISWELMLVFLPGVVFG